MTVARKYFHLNINQVDAVRGPEVVAAVELEEDEEGEEEAGNPRYVCIHLLKQIIKSNHKSKY